MENQHGLPAKAEPSALAIPLTQSPPTAGNDDAKPWSADALPPTLPDASQPSATADASALNPRSCITCRRRKVRCDKQVPCANCRRAQIACIFPAPGRAPRRPRPKDPNAPPKNSSEREVELMKRLRKLEGIVEELSGQIDVDPTSGRHQSSSGDSPEAGVEAHRSGSLGGSSDQNSPSRTQAAQKDSVSPLPTESGSDNLRGSVTRQGSSGLHKTFGRLVLNEKGKSRYVSNAFWSRLNDEVSWRLPRSCL